MKNIFLILIGLFLFSCISQSKIDKICKTCPTKTYDSIREVIRIKERIVEVPVPYKDTTVTDGDNLCKLLCDSAQKIIDGQKIVIKGKNGSKTTFKTDKGKVSLIHENDSLKALLKSIDTTKSTIEIKKEVIESKCEKNHLKWFDPICRWFTLIALVLIGLYLFLKVKRVV